MYPSNWDREKVAGLFESNDCELLEMQYKNSKTPMIYQCKCGNVSKISLDNFRKGKRCAKCANDRPYDYGHVANVFAEGGCELLETEYKNAITPMLYKCQCGKIAKISFASFRKGSRCWECGRAKLKYTLDEVQTIFQEAGCTLLEDDYKDNSVPMLYKCSCGDTSRIALGNFLLGNRCKGCKGEKISRKKRLPYDVVFQTFKNAGCELLEMEYTNAHVPMLYRCNCGNIAKISLSNFNEGKRCSQCGHERGGQKRKRPDREKLAIEHNFRQKCCGMVRKTFNSFDRNKNQHTFELLGYNGYDLKLYIENHPNWIHVKDTKWHIDHIFPIRAFMDYDIFDVRLINCLENLRPLPASENQRKHAKYNHQEFENWLTSKGVKYEQQ